MNQATMAPAAITSVNCLAINEKKRRDPNTNNEVKLLQLKCLRLTFAA